LLACRWPSTGQGPVIMFPDLDAADQRLAEMQKRVRRAVAVAATSRKKLELELGSLGIELWEPDGRRREGLETGRPGTAGASAADEGISEQRLDELRLEYTAFVLQEERAIEASLRLDGEINAFRNARKTMEAACAAAEEAAKGAVS
jgi:hypothetical protein